MKSFFREFKTFMLRGNMADLAIGFVLGTSFNGVTNSLAANIITPPLGLLLGKIDFKDLVIPLGGTVKISYGLFLQSVVNFIVIVLALFLVVRFINHMQELAARKQQAASTNPPMPVDSPELSVLKEIRDSLRSKDD
jgi:large conductance mechanosensitive channel